ncbi:hypothetical protein [Mesorhizobium marinum]|uniref:Uncharacterized protein n=1 Tax=Mesorhizobium marinum TaxID=3228790 RepID=A0ABV3QWS7_9HYPH
MRTMLTVAALALFAVSTGWLEMANARHRPITALPPAMGDFGQAAIDRTDTSSIPEGHSGELRALR